MRPQNFWSCAVVLSSGVSAQPDVQQNYTICNWARLRAGIVRDAIYLDGGLLWWQTAFVDGSTPVVSSDGGASGDMYRLNLSKPFDTSSTNLSALLEPLPKAGGAGNNIAPTYIDGFMATNDGELYLYGGLPHLTDSATGQTADAVLGYEAYQYGPDRSSWQPGFYQGSSGDNVTRYVTNGAGVSAPSENLAFYFSGMRAPDWGEIHYEDASASTTADTMIEVDMSVMREEQWTNLTLPDEVRPRANAELVWLPVAERGILVAIGGVTDPEEIYPTGLNNTQGSQSEEASPSFMTSIPLYDIASDKWYIQNTSGSEAPPQLTQFCSAVAVDEDASSFNIYIYGGYNGLDANDPPSDDVWVLSLPSFTWTRVYEGNTAHGRSGHKCLTPYPDKMFVIGGVRQNQAQCLDGGFLQVFDMNKLEFQSIYRPAEWGQYKAPQKITTNTRRSLKRQLNWASSDLERLFSTPYTREIEHFYPYETDGSIGDELSGSDSGSGSSVNTTAVAVGVSIGVLIIGITLVVMYLLRRRGMLRSGSSMSSRTKRSRISRWIQGTANSNSRGKGDDADSMSSLNPGIVQNYSNASAQVSSEPSTPPVAAHIPSREKVPPQEMMAVDRPHPPFELATPYNNQDHPKHLSTIDYAYKTTTGHGSTESTSSEGDQRPIISYQQDATDYDDIVKEARASVDAASSDRSSSSSNAPTWPLPATRTNWSRNVSASSNNSDATTHLLAPMPAIPSMPQQYRSLSHNNTPARLRPIMPGQTISNTSSSGPSSQSRQESSISSLVSPVHETQEEGWEQQHPARGSTGRVRNDAFNRQSLLGAISPITPEEPNYLWHDHDGPGHSRRGSEEGGERWCGA